MSKVLNQIPQIFFSFNIYLRNVFVVFSGSSLSVLIPIISVPLLTRLYTPEDFGKYGFAYSMGLLLGVFCTLRYEHSIVIAKTDREAFQAIRLCELLILTINLLSLFIIAGLQIGLTIFHLGEWWYGWYLTIPFVSTSAALFRVQTLLANRGDHYKFVSKVKVTQGILITFFSIIFGVLGFLSNGMVWAFIIGNSIGAILLYQKNKSNLSISMHDLLTIARRYANFPYFSLPAELINNVTLRYPLIVFPFLFGNEVAGFLTLAYRVVAMPARFVSTAVSEVFFQRASKDMREKNQCRHLFVFTSVFLATISIIGFTILFFLSDFIFTLLFDPIWTKTSAYIKILIPLFLINFIVSPLSTMIYISEKQTWDLYFQSFYLLMMIGSTLCTWYFYGKLEVVLLSMVIAAIFSYFLYFILLFILTKQKMSLEIIE